MKSPGGWRKVPAYMTVGVSTALASIQGSRMMSFQAANHVPLDSGSIYRGSVHLKIWDILCTGYPIKHL